MNEQEIIARFRAQSPRIGDDAAVVGSDVITNDMLIEDVDFTRAIPLELIARKSLATNLSDLAAMGATPRHCLIALGIPEWPDHVKLADALIAAAKQFGIEIIGGDLSKAEKLTISITAIGTAERPLLRSGAKAGERIYVSRPIGGSSSGLYLLNHGWTLDQAPPGTSYAQREFGFSAIRRHVDPEPETALGIALAKIAEVSACIDISDGLSTDLHHLCEESSCGAEIERERIPIFPDLLGAGTALRICVPDVVVHGGEEYALLFTSSLRESELSARLGRPVYSIGRVTKEREVRLNGQKLEPKGFDHFG